MLRCSPVLLHLNTASVSKDIHHEIVEPLQELSLVGRVSERETGAMFALGRVTCHIVVIAELDALAVNAAIMLLFAPTSRR